MTSIWREKGDKSHDIYLEIKWKKKLWHQFGDKMEEKVMTSIWRENGRKSYDINLERKWRQEVWHQLGEKRETKRLWHQFGEKKNQMSWHQNESCFAHQCICSVIYFPSLFFSLKWSPYFIKRLSLQDDEVPMERIPHGTVVKKTPLPHQTPTSAVFTSKARSAVAESGGGSLNAGTAMQTGVGSTVKPVGTAHSQQVARATAGKGVGGFCVNSALTWSPESKSTAGQWTFFIKPG